MKRLLIALCICIAQSSFSEEPVKKEIDAEGWQTLKCANEQWAACGDLRFKNDTNGFLQVKNLGKRHAEVTVEYRYTNGGDATQCSATGKTGSRKTLVTPAETSVIKTKIVEVCSVTAFAVNPPEVPNIPKESGWEEVECELGDGSSGRTRGIN